MVTAMNPVPYNALRYFCFDPTKAGTEKMYADTKENLDAGVAPLLKPGEWVDVYEVRKVAVITHPETTTAQVREELDGPFITQP